MNCKNLVKLGFVTLLSIGMTDCLLGQSNDDASLESAPIQQRQNGVNLQDQRINDILDSPVTLDYDETPFIDFMDEFRREFSINIVLDQSARDDALSEKDIVTFSIRDISMRSALRLMLDRFNATFLVRDEVLLIVSKEVAKNPEFFNRKIINCETILEKIRNTKNQGEDAISSVQRVSDFAEGRGVGGGVFDLLSGDQIPGLVDGAGQVDQEEQAKTWFVVKRGYSAEADLIDTIISSVTPDDWDSTNGDGSITMVGGCLVIQQTDDAIRQVESLLAQLSSVMDQE